MMADAADAALHLQKHEQPAPSFVAPRWSLDTATTVSYNRQGIVPRVTWCTSDALFGLKAFEDECIVGRTQIPSTDM